MPPRADLKKILLIGSGPITIGQAAEFDYSGTQAVKALRQAGYQVVLVNPNPATIMTDPELAEATYLEPLQPEFLEAIIARERPDALLPTLGGQTALNLAVKLYESGILERYGVELIGAGYQAIITGEDREKFQAAMLEIGLEVPRGRMVHSTLEGLDYARELGFPVVVRPSFTLGGSGGGIARDEQELTQILEFGLELSPAHSALVEESVLGFKEFELEVMRDHADTVVIITSIENFDPMGAHTGDSITVAPAQTLSDLEYQKMRDAAIAIIRKIGVDTGGSNIQFAVDPKTSRMLVIEMNPRVSRSSALASKATGYPIAKIAALLAVGYRLDEIPNDITQKTPASFEPAIDYVVVKVPRFAFEKFAPVSQVLGTQMKAVGEVMALGGSFKEALEKALRGLESDSASRVGEKSTDQLLNSLEATPSRIFALYELLRRGVSIAELYQRTGIDPWFLAQIQEIVELEADNTASWLELKAAGIADARLAQLRGQAEGQIRAERQAAGVRPVYKTVDTCAAEFEAYTPYHYSTYAQEDEVQPSAKPKVVVLGSGPIRIGQGVEFDYATVHAVWALRERGYETIMVNSNPETVSTDYDTADRLYFEPLTSEDVLHLVQHENPLGVIATLGGQTPLKLAAGLEAAGVRLLGTGQETIDLLEDRDRFGALCDQLGIARPEGWIAKDRAQAWAAAAKLTYPILARPSYVLGGRAMRVVRGPAELENYLTELESSLNAPSLWLDRYLEGALELDVDAICDGELAIVAGIMEHIEPAGVHSGDSAAILPTVHLPAEAKEQVAAYTRALALAAGVRGLINVQYAYHQGVIYALEANPRASRTLPFVSKATGHPLAKYAARIALGESLSQIGFTQDPNPAHYSAKEVLIPWLKFPGVIPELGPEMRSTGESMGLDRDPYLAYYRAELGAGQVLPLSGKVRFLGSDLAAIRSRYLEAGFAETASGDYDLLIATARDSERRRALETGRPLITTQAGAEWSLEAILRARSAGLEPRALQEWLAPRAKITLK